MKGLIFTLIQLVAVLIISVIWSEFGSVSMFEATTWVGIIVILTNQNHIRFEEKE